MPKNHLPRLLQLELNDPRVVDGRPRSRTCPSGRLPLGPHGAIGMWLALFRPDGAHDVRGCLAGNGLSNDLRASARAYLEGDDGKRLLDECERTGARWAFIIETADTLRLNRWEGLVPAHDLRDVDDFNAAQAALPDWRTANPTA